MLYVQSVGTAGISLDVWLTLGKAKLVCVNAHPSIGDEINFDSRGEAAQAHTPKPYVTYHIVTAAL